MSENNLVNFLVWRTLLSIFFRGFFFSSSSFISRPRSGFLSCDPNTHPILSLFCCLASPPQKEVIISSFLEQRHHPHVGGLKDSVAPDHLESTASEKFQSFSPSKFEDESKLIEEQEKTEKMEIISSKALEILKRVTDKLHGKDFADHDTAVLDVPSQVQRLIEAAQAPENLSQCYIGWCPFW